MLRSFDVRRIQSMSRYAQRHNLIPVILLVLVACAPKTLPPELKSAYTANEVLMRVSELQKTTIGLYDRKVIDKNYAEPIVMFTILAAEAIENHLVDANWRVEIKKLWIELKQIIKKVPTEFEMVWTLTDLMITQM